MSAYNNTTASKDAGSCSHVTMSARSKVAWARAGGLARTARRRCQRRARRSSGRRGPWSRELRRRIQDRGPLRSALPVSPGHRPIPRSGPCPRRFWDWPYLRRRGTRARSRRSHGEQDRVGSLARPKSRRRHGRASARPTSRSAPASSAIRWAIPCPRDTRRLSPRAARTRDARARRAFRAPLP
jgi:hypothetical protein